MKKPTQISSLPALGACLLSLLAPLHAADITFVGHQDAVEADADTPTSGWRNTSPAKPLDIDGNHILGTDGYEVAGVRSNPGYAWITRTAPNFNASPGWGLWDTPSNPSGNDTLAAALYHGAGADVFEIVIHGDSLAGKTLRLGVLYGVFGGSSTFSITQTVGGNQKVTTPALSFDGTTLNAAFFNITGAMEGDTFLVSRTPGVGGGESFSGITFDSAPTSPATELPEVPGTVRGTYAAPLEVSRIFSDNGVLQRGTVLPVWGWDDPGTEVTVQFAGQTVTGTADAQGRWVAQLQPLTANSTSRTMTVSAGAATIHIQNLLVGDVWLCSGQSNMWMNFNTSMRADMPDFIDPDSLPTIRHIKIKEGSAEFPQKKLANDNASWTVCNSATVIDYTAVGFFFAYFVAQETGVPIGLINSTLGNSRIESWVSPAGIELVSDQIPASAFSSGIYFGQIAPLRGYRLTGALWYQGENNGGEGDSYFWKMKALFQGWRNEWQQGDFPFYYAQLPSYDGSGSWAPTREAQRRALTITHTGMATLVDVGGVGLTWPMNLHPPNKYDVGRRLAQWALANEYGQTGLVPSGPLFKSAVFSGANVTISYDYVGSGLVTAKKPSPQSIEPPAPVDNLAGFELAGANNVWHPANAVIQGATVVLSSASVPSPQAARYLYAMNTDAGTLYNQENLPAAPFLTTAADNPNPPNVPTGLNAAPGDGRVDLAWNAPGGAESYEVKRGTTPGGPYSTIGSPSSTSYADTTVTNGTTYYYVVLAVNTVGQSANSTEASATPQASTNPPLAPTGLAATPGNGRVDLSWNASGNTGGYKVKRGTSQGGPYPVIGTTPGTSFADTTAVNGTTYYYVVSAGNAFGESPDSGVASATPSSGVTTISYAGDHIGIESDTNGANDGGWRSIATAKPLDIDGDDIYGTDGYWFHTLKQQPSYVSATTALWQNGNSAAGWAAWDKPDASGDQEYAYLRDGAAGVFPDTIYQFVIGGTELDGQVLRVGCYGTVFPHTQKYTITQTVGGSGLASSPVTAFTGSTMDGVFFDISGAKAGDTFVVSIDGGGAEGMAGITFDTASSAARITSFEGSGATGVINHGAKTIALTVPFGTDLATLAPTFTLTSGTCNQTSGAVPTPGFATQNTVDYVVTDTATDPDTINTYSVTVTVAPEIATLVIDLGTSPAGTAIEGGAFIGSGPTNLPLPAVPAGSILKSIAVDAVLEATDNGNYASDLSLLLDPTPGTPGGDFSVEITNGTGPLGGAALDLNWPSSAEAGVGTNLVDTKTEADWAAAGAIDLSTTGMFLGNAFGTAPAGGTWSGTITLTYEVGSGVPSDSYSTWATGNEPFAGDANGDGVADGLAFLLGAATPATDATSLLPTVSQSGGNLVMEFDCLATSDRGGSVLNLQYDGDLAAPWTSALVPGAIGNTTVGNVSFVATANGSLIHIVATVDDATEAAAGKLFGRLEGTE